MKHIKKFILLFMLIVTCSIITGCEEEASVINNPTNIDANHTHQDTNVDNDTNTDNDTIINFIGVDKNHEININSDTIKLTSSYQIPDKRLNNYVFTVPSVIKLSIKLAENSRYNIRVSHLYSDVYVSSRLARFNGLRQDSMDLNFIESKNNRFDIDATNSFEQLFQVESVNQNESFIHGWNGYISEHYKYLSESDIRSNSNGAILRCVWTLSIYDSETDKTYSKYISDEIFMASY